MNEILILLVIFMLLCILVLMFITGKLSGYKEFQKINEDYIGKVSEKMIEFLKSLTKEDE